MNDAGQPVPNARVLLLRDDGAREPVTVAGAQSNEYGIVKFQSVAPGDYTLRTSFGADGDAQVALAKAVVHGADVKGIQIAAQPLVTLVGTVSIEGEARNLSGVQVRAVAVTEGEAGLGDSRASIRTDGSFELRARPTRVLLRTGQLPAGLGLKSISVDNQSIVNAPLDLKPGQNVERISIVLTTQVANVSGVVLDRAGKPLAD